MPGGPSVHFSGEACCWFPHLRPCLPWTYQNTALFQYYLNSTFRTSCKEPVFSFDEPLLSSAGVWALSWSSKLISLTLTQHTVCSYWSLSGRFLSVLSFRSFIAVSLKLIIAWPLLLFGFLYTYQKLIHQALWKMCGPSLNTLSASGNSSVPKLFSLKTTSRSPSSPGSKLYWLLPCVPFEKYDNLCPNTYLKQWSMHLCTWLLFPTSAPGGAQYLDISISPKPIMELKKRSNAWIKEQIKEWTSGISL